MRLAFHVIGKKIVLVVFPYCWEDLQEFGIQVLFENQADVSFTIFSATRQNMTGFSLLRCIKIPINNINKFLLRLLSRYDGSCTNKEDKSEQLSMVCDLSN